MTNDVTWHVPHEAFDVWDGLGSPLYAPGVRQFRKSNRPSLFPRHPSFVIRHSSLDIPPGIARHPSFVIRHSSLDIPPGIAWRTRVRLG